MESRFFMVEFRATATATVYAAPAVLVGMTCFRWAGIRTARSGPSMTMTIHEDDHDLGAAAQMLTLMVGNC
jgi:hypothetical protein